MNLTLLAAVAMLLAWLLLVFAAHVPTGYVHLLYAGAVILFARRVLLGAQASARDAPRDPVGST